MTWVNLASDLALDATLQEILTELQGKANQTETQPVALSAGDPGLAFLAGALEAVTATISNFPVDYPDAAVLAKLEQIRVLIGGVIEVSGPLTDAELRASPVDVTGPLTDDELRATPVPVTGAVTTDGLTDSELRASPVPVSGTVTLDGPTLAALENITVAVAAGQIIGLDSTTLTALENIIVTGTVALDGPTLAALESITVAGTVALDGATLAALESITATISGSVAVTGPLTDSELRATPVPVDTGLTTQTDALTDAELRASPVPVTDVELMEALREAGIYGGAVSSVGVLSAPLDLIDTSNQSVAYIHLRGTFIATILVEGTNDPLGLSNWTALTLHSATSGARSSSVKNAGIFAINILPHFIRVRCSAYTSGTVIVDLVVKPVNELSPGRYITDADGLARWALSTFGTGIVAQKTFLAGSDFAEMDVLDEAIWTDLSTDTGSLVFSNGELELSTGNGASAVAGIQSVHAADFLGGADNEITIVARQGDTGSADHLFRFGVYDDDNGTFVEINSTGVDFKVRKGGVDASSAFGILGITSPTNTTSNQFWFITFNPNFIIFRQGSNFVQIFIGSASLTPLFDRTDLPLRAEAINLTSGTSHSLFLQTLVANRLGSPSTIRANQTFSAEDVLAATAATIHARQPDGDFVPVRADGTAHEYDVPLGAAGVHTTPIIDTDGWASAEVFVATDQVSAADGIAIYFVRDTGAAVPVLEGPRVFTFTADDVGRGFATYRFPTELDGMIIEYTNGGVAQSEFYLAITVRIGTVAPQGGFEQSVGPTNIAAMTRGLVLAADDIGTYANVRRLGLALRVALNASETEVQAKSCSTGSQVALTASATPAQIDVAKLSNRKYVTISNADGTRTVFYGTGAALTASNGIALPPESTHLQEWDNSLDIYVCTATSTASVRLHQSGGTP